MCLASCITQNYSTFEAKHKSWVKFCCMMWLGNKLIRRSNSISFLEAWFHLSDAWNSSHCLEVSSYICYLIQPANLTCMSPSYPLNYHWKLRLYLSKLSVHYAQSHSLPTCNLASQKSTVSRIKLKLWAAGSCMFVAMPTDECLSNLACIGMYFFSSCPGPPTWFTNKMSPTFAKVLAKKFSILIGVSGTNFGKIAPDVSRF